MNKWMIQLTISVFLILQIVPMAGAGEWVEYELDSYGWDYCAAGGDGVGVAEATSNSLLFFNARTSVWTEYELVTPMPLVTILAKGFLVLVVGTDRAVVFNTMNSTVSELAYAGSLLSTSSTSRSFQCGPELALVVTDQEFCVFDTEMDQWQRHTHSLTGISNITSKHECHDVYAVSYMRMTNGDLSNIVYSQLLHGFNETSQGISSSLGPIDHGFAGFRNSTSPNRYLLGYSAVTNTFDHVPFPDGLPHELAAANWYSDSIGPLTAYAGYYYEDFSDDIRHYNIYGYDTRHGDWQHHLLMVNRTDISLSGLRAGGSLCSARYWHIDSGNDDLLVFDGIANSFYILPLALNHTASFQLAGNVLVGHDDEVAVGIDLDSGNQSICTNPYYGRYFPGLSYQDYLSEGPGEGMLTVNCYNGNHNTWLHHTSGTQASEGRGTEHVHIRKSGEPQPEAIFYSSYRHEIYAMSLAGWPLTSYLITDNYAGVCNSTEGEAALYDAHRGTVYSWSGFDRAGGGEQYFMTLNNTNHDVQAYSLITGTWSSYTLEATGVIHSGPDLIGLAKSATGSYYNVFYAHDARDGSWAVLHPFSVLGALGVGDRTAYFVTNYKAYALGSSGLSPVSMNFLSLQGGHGAVEARWEGDFDLDVEAVRLTAHGPEGSSSLTWSVPVVREGARRFRALDNSPNLVAGGMFTYTIEMAAADDKWSPVATEQIHLNPVPLALIKQIHPNPFNPKTTIEFSLAAPMGVKLCVYDLAGRRVRVLLDEVLEVGTHTEHWDGCNDFGHVMASGVYTVRLESEAAIDRRKVMLVR